METVSLVPHPAAPSSDVRAITVDLAWVGDALSLTYRVDHGGSLNVPARNGRLDELWKTTCFEIFVREGAGPAYVEFNLAPDNAWAGYGFTGERHGMHNLPVAEPLISARVEGRVLELDVTLAPGSLPDNLGLASLSAVIEEQGGTKSYWAIVHPKPAAFDFHDPRCFILDLARPVDAAKKPLSK